MKLDIVDAFITGNAFSGNPAAVVRAERPLTDSLMQKIAAQHNLAETAFIWPLDAAANRWDIRWFSPLTEVELCGHATLAAAYSLFCDYPALEQLQFISRRHGALSVSLRPDGLALDLPIQTQRLIISPPAQLARAIPAGFREIFLGMDWLVVYDDAEIVIQAQPDLALIRQLPDRGVILTATGLGECDFISRFFAPRIGIDEDAVTGSAHCALAPYWGVRLEKQRLSAWQASARGGLLSMEMSRGRVSLIGQCRLYSRGWIYLEGS